MYLQECMECQHNFSSDAQFLLTRISDDIFIKYANNISAQHAALKKLFKDLGFQSTLGYFDEQSLNALHAMFQLPLFDARTHTGFVMKRLSDGQPGNTNTWKLISCCIQSILAMNQLEILLSPIEITDLYRQLLDATRMIYKNTKLDFDEQRSQLKALFQNEPHSDWKSEVSYCD